MFKAGLLAAALLIPGTAHAASVSAAKPESVVKALVAGGNSAELVTDDLGDPQINAQIGGWKSVVLFYDCTPEHSGCRALQFRSSFDAPQGMTPDAALAFMRANRFASVVLDQNGDPRLSWDLVTGGGLDDDVFAEALAGYASALAAMDKLVFPKAQ